MPKISVVMPAYNAEKYIAEAIESILNQTYTDFEFIIINDCSNDNTEKIILSYKDNRIKYLKNEINMGIANTLNRGISVARGEYIARMDSDDIAMLPRLEKQVRYLEENDRVGLLGTATVLFGEERKEQQFVFATEAKQAKADMFFSSCVAHPTVMFRKNILELYGLSYRPEYDGMEDYFLWWEMAHYVDVLSLSEPLLKYRMHNKQITKQRNEVVSKRVKDFLGIRLQELSAEFTYNEENVIYDYLMGNFEKFDTNYIKYFIEVLIKILKLNKKNKCYPCRQLAHTFELAVVFTIDNASNIDSIKKKQRRYAIKHHAISPVMGVKLLRRGRIF